jgi:hypothetical protein
MADTKNTEEVPPAPEPAASAPTAAPATVIRERGGWVTPLIAALVVVVTLVVGGVGGFALAAATHAGARPAMHQSLLPGQGPQQGPGGTHGDRPNLPPDRPEESDESTDEPEEGDSTEG